MRSEVRHRCTEPDSDSSHCCPPVRKVGVVKDQEHKPDRRGALTDRCDQGVGRNSYLTKGQWVRY